ncbi:MAG: hypothetical protein JWM95_5602 [Gemmatimonadetes bacterium]|nr:hypothetical protein [Gemmatimonadota bacterium]
MIWGTADFKGQFRTADGGVLRSGSRSPIVQPFRLTCHGLLSTETLTAKPIFERALRDYGLPLAIACIAA